MNIHFEYWLPINFSLHKVFVVTWLCNSWLTVMKDKNKSDISNQAIKEKKKKNETGKFNIFLERPPLQKWLLTK